MFSIIVVNTNFSEDNKDDIVMDVSMPSKSVLEDPGWDFNATKITLPAWGKVNFFFIIGKLQTYMMILLVKLSSHS